MRARRALLTQTRYALISASRNPRVIVFGIAFPIVLLVLFNSIFASGSNRTTQFAGGTITSKAYFTAGLTAYAITLQTFTQLVVSVTTQRESGQLKRLRGTPMPAWTFVGAYVLRSLVLVVLMVVALMGIGVVAFGVELRTEAIPGILVYAALGTAAMTTLGIAATVLTSSVDAATSVGPFAVVILSFISGVFLPVSQLPGWLESVGRVFPLYHLSDGLQRTLSAGAGTGLVGGDLLALGLWGAGGLLFAARRFHWEPQAASA